MTAAILIAASVYATAPADFPLQSPADSHLLLSRSGQPFPILGRATPNILALPTDAQDQVLDRAVAQGFNTLEFPLMPSAPSPERLPFTQGTDGAAPDFNHPNPEYWRAAADFVRRCQLRGIACLVSPLVVGDGAVSPTDSTRFKSFGEFVGRTFSRYGNIVWLIEGGLTRLSPTQRTAISQVYAGIRSIRSGRSTLWSAERDSIPVADDADEFHPEVGLDRTLPATGSVVEVGHRAFRRTPGLPAYLDRLTDPPPAPTSTGDHDPDKPVLPMRQILWSGLLSAIGGYVDARPEAEDTAELAVANQFITGFDWGRLRPIFPETDAIRGNARPGDAAFIVSAASVDGDRFVAYFPNASPAEARIDFKRFARVRQLRWLDPTSGEIQINQGFVPGHPNAIAKPGPNHRGQNDWVLIGA